MAKCHNCLEQHPWQKYEKPVYWSLPNDGALIKCRDCEKYLKNSEVLLTQIPCGHRAVICKECLDPYWKSIAVNMGMFKE